MTVKLAAVLLLFCRGVLQHVLQHENFCTETCHSPHFYNYNSWCYRYYDDYCDYYDYYDHYNLTPEHHRRHFKQGGDVCSDLHHRRTRLTLSGSDAEDGNERNERNERDKRNGALVSKRKMAV